MFSVKIAAVFLLSLFILFAIGVVINVALTLKPVVRGDMTAAFAWDLVDYTKFHHGNLPDSWDDFCKWMKESKSSERWKSESLKREFIILRKNIVRGKEVERYVEITDPANQGMEDFINQRLHASVFEGTNRPPP